MTKKSRDIGNRGELRACAMLTKDGRWGKVVSTRKGLGGTRRGEDLMREVEPNVFEPLPVSIEVKAGEQAFTTDWIAQAKEQAGDRPWLLIWIPKFCRKGREWMIEPHPQYGWAMTWFDNWSVAK